MDNIWAFTFGAAERNGLGVAAGVTEEMIRVGMKSQRQKTGGTEGLPTTVFTDGKGGRATAIMED